jgi:hypothetical protein
MGDVMGEAQRGIVLPFFEEDDGLAADADDPGQLELREVLFGP